MEKNPRKYLHSVGDGETVEFGVTEGEEGGAGPAPVQGSKYAVDTAMSQGLHALPSRITGIVRVGERTRNRRVLPKAGQQPWPYGRGGSISLHVASATVFRPCCVGRSDGGC